MFRKSILIFDTSALDRLARESDTALKAGVTEGYAVRLTTRNISEIVATVDIEQRNKLLDLCMSLLRNGECILPFNEIAKELVIEFERGGRFDWRSVGIRAPEVEQEIIRREIINDQLAAEERESSFSAEDEFVKVFRDAEPHFAKIFKEGKDLRPASLGELISRLQIKDGAFWSLGIQFYERAAGRSPDEETIRRFVDACPPFQGLLLAAFAASYERCIRELANGKPSLRAGRVDVLMSVYLPYCDEFITADQRQENCLKEVAALGSLDVRVRAYEEFAGSFCVKLNV